MNSRATAVCSEKDLTLDDLFCSQRLQTDSMNVWHWLVLILYFPIGSVLAITRFVLAFIIAVVTPEKYRHRLFRFVGGLCCKTVNPIGTPPITMPSSGALILSNHSNYLDPFVINATLEKQHHLGVVIWHGVNFFSRVMCRPTVSVLDKGGNLEFLRRLNKANESHNMIVFPEGAVTDSISGLLRFQRSVFRLEQPMYLVAIKYHRAFPFLRGKAMSRAMGLEVLVDLFQPWINVELIPLGKFQRDQNHRPQQEADAAQQIIANALGLKPSRWDKNDRHKRLYPDESAG